MEGDRARRRLAAIVAADVVGYSRLIGADEEGTLARLKALRRELIDPKIAEHSGRIVKTTGDGLLLEFASAVDALRCVIEIQRGMAARESGLPEGKRLELRIGVNVGDIVVDGDDILGDGVNVAARLETIAEPGGICVSARVYEDVRGRLDLDVQDFGERQLKNIERPIRVYRVSVEAARPERPALPLPDKPSIAVLPFQNMSGDPEQEYFADGMVEEIITALSRFHGFFVIARNSSFTYKGRAVDIKQVARELGVRYVLEGSVRKAGQKVRITGQLIDATTGAHLWADKFDGELSDVFELQDKVAVSVVTAIEPTLRQAEIERTYLKPTQSLDAYDHLLRAYAFSQAVGSRESYDSALRSLNQALAIDRTFASAAGLAAWCYIVRFSMRWTTDSEAEEKEVRRLIQIVTSNDRSDPVAIAYAALALAHVVRDYDPSIALIDHALSLNTNAFSIWNANGWIRLYVHDPHQGLESFHRARRLNPLDPFIHFTMHGLSAAYWFLDEFDDSLRWARLSVQAMPYSTVYQVLLIQVLVSANKLDEARAAVQKLLSLVPNFTISQFATRRLPYRNPEMLQLRIDALRTAGLPE